MSSDAHKQLVRRVVAEGVNRADLDVFRDAVTPDYRRHSQASSGMEEIEGVDAFVKFLEWNFSAFPDWHEEIEVMLGEGDLVAYVTTGTGTHTGPMGETPPTGKTIRVQNFIVHRFEGGADRGDLGRVGQPVRARPAGTVPAADGVELTGGPERRPRNTRFPLDPHAT